MSGHACTTEMATVDDELIISRGQTKREGGLPTAGKEPPTVSVEDQITVGSLRVVYQLVHHRHDRVSPFTTKR